MAPQMEATTNEEAGMVFYNGSEPIHQCIDPSNGVIFIHGKNVFLASLNWLETWRYTTKLQSCYAKNRNPRTGGWMQLTYDPENPVGSSEMQSGWKKTWY